MASQYDPGRDPNIQVTSANLPGDRRLVLSHRLNNEIPLAEADAKGVLSFVADLWGFDVELRGVNVEGAERYSYKTSPAPMAVVVH